MLPRPKPKKYSAKQYLLEFSRRGSVPPDLTEQCRELKNENDALFFLIKHHIILWSAELRRKDMIEDLTLFQRFLIRIGRIKL